MIQTAIVEGLNTRGGKGALASFHKTEDKPHPRAKYKDLTQDTIDTGSRSVREFGALCVPPKTKKRVQNISVADAT